MRSVAHQNNFDMMYQTLIKVAIGQNKQLESQRRFPIQNYDKLFLDDVKLPLSDDREIDIKLVRIPTFTKYNQPQYYTIFFVNTPWWRKEDLPIVSNMCRTIIDQRYKNTDSFSVFIVGYQVGYIDYRKTKKYAKTHHIYAINARRREPSEAKAQIFKIIEDFVRLRCKHIYEKIKNKQVPSRWGVDVWKRGHPGSNLKIFGILKSCWVRLNHLHSDFHKLMMKAWNDLQKIRLKRTEEQIEEEKNTTVSIIGSIIDEKAKRKRAEGGIDRYFQQIKRQTVIKPI